MSGRFFRCYCYWSCDHAYLAESITVDLADAGAEVASGLLVSFRPAGGGVRTFENSTLNGEGLSRALSGTGNSRDATGDKERSGTRISGRVGRFDVIRVCSNIIGVGRASTSNSGEASTTWCSVAASTMVNTILAVQMTAARIPPAMMPPLAPPTVELVELGWAEEVASGAGWIPCEGR